MKSSMTIPRGNQHNINKAVTKLNNDRRKILASAKQDLVSASGKVSDVLADERESFFSLPEGFQNSPKGEAIENSIENLSQAVLSIFSATNSINDAC